LFMRARYDEKEVAMKAVNDQQRVEIEELRQRIAELEPDEDH